MFGRQDASQHEGGMSYDAMKRMALPCSVHVVHAALQLCGRLVEMQV